LFVFVSPASADHGSHSNALWAQHEKLRLHYEKAYTMAIEEARLAGEVVLGVKAVLRRRERKALQRSAAAAAAATAAAMVDVDEGDGAASASEPDDDDEPLVQRPPATTGGGGGSGARQTVLSKHDKLNIWYHDAASVLPVGSEVAALIDEHSIPQLWVQCVVKGYRPGAVSLFLAGAATNACGGGAVAV
jgi:hypothetical protein